MESLFVVLGVIGGLIAGFAITYFAFVGKLQKKLASAKRKLDRAQSANEDTETLQAQFDAQKGELQAAQSKLESLETDHQAQIDQLEAQHATALQELDASKMAIAAELEDLRQSTVAVDQLPPDHSEELAALQNRLGEVEQYYQDTLQALEARHQAELASLQQSLAVAPPTVETEPQSPGQWGAAAIAGGAAALGAGMAALGNFGRPAAPETEEEELPAENFTPDPDLEAIAPEIPVFGEEVREETVGEVDLGEFGEEEGEHSPFGKPEGFEAESLAEYPLGDMGTAVEDLSPFAPPETPFETENWVDAPDLPLGDDVAMAGLAVEENLEAITEATDRDVFGEELPPADFEADSPTPFELSPEAAIDTENWVDADDLDMTPDALDGGFDFGEAAPEQGETPDSELLDMGVMFPPGVEDEDFAVELPDLGGTQDLDLGLELPDMTEEPVPTFGELDLADQDLGALDADIPDGDQLLAELTGTDNDDGGLDLFTLDGPTPDTEGLADELALPSDPGDLLDMPDSFLADIPSFIPEPDTEELIDLGAGAGDDLDFLLQLQEDEPPSSPGEEFLPEFNDEDALGSAFPTMELLADDNPELSELLGEGGPTHGGDPFINILDQSLPSSDNELLALLQDDDGDDAHHHDGDDDLFSGLEGMLNTDTPDNESDLDDLDALLNSAGELGPDQGDVFSLEDLGLGEENR